MEVLTSHSPPTRRGFRHIRRRKAPCRRGDHRRRCQTQSGSAALCPATIGLDKRLRLRQRNLPHRGGGNVGHVRLRIGGRQPLVTILWRALMRVLAVFRCLRCALPTTAGAKSRVGPRRELDRLAAVLASPPVHHPPPGQTPHRRRCALRQLSEQNRASARHADDSGREQQSRLMLLYNVPW